MAHPAREGSTTQPVVVRYGALTYPVFTATTDTSATWATNVSAVRAPSAVDYTIEGTGPGDLPVHIVRTSLGMQVTPGFYRVVVTALLDGSVASGIALVREVNSAGNAIVRSDELVDAIGLNFPAFMRYIKLIRHLEITEEEFSAAGDNLIRLNPLIVAREAGTLSVRNLFLEVAKIGSTY